LAEKIRDSVDFLKDHAHENRKGKSGKKAKTTYQIHRDSPPISCISMRNL